MTECFTSKFALCLFDTAISYAYFTLDGPPLTPPDALAVVVVEGAGMGDMTVCSAAAPSAVPLSPMTIGFSAPLPSGVSEMSISIVVSMATALPKGGRTTCVGKPRLLRRGVGFGLGSLRGKSGGLLRRSDGITLLIIVVVMIIIIKIVVVIIKMILMV